VRVVLVSHSHWDREWYRPFEAFRARLVDLVDAVLAHVHTDPGFRFLLDGQAIVVEDYLAIRPARRDDLARACRAGRVSVGPWWVQPDSLLPSGEAHVRNLLEGRRAAALVGVASPVAYCPDSFGHPAQLPQLFAAFGLGPFVYWRGDDGARHGLGAEWRWEAPDGSVVPALHLAEGYFAAAGLPADPEAAGRRLAAVAGRLAATSRLGLAVLMNGFDHALPEPQAGAAAAALARVTSWTVVRGTLDDVAAELRTAADLPVFRGALTGARVANLLPGVWSARLPQKLRNRRCEALLEGWAEPWAALAARLGAPDERAALRLAWRALLQNQAHDSLGGCSQDRVHEQMAARYDTAAELASETTTRALERLAGLGVERDSPWSDAFDVAVFNPSPHPRSDLVRVPLVPRSWLRLGGGDAALELHPWLGAGLHVAGFTVDGRPARLVAEPGPDRIRLVPDVPAHAVEFVAEDVPALGWRRFRLAPAAAHPDQTDDGREVGTDALRVVADDDGTLTVAFGAQRFAGLLALDDVGDRGDTYDHDPVDGGPIAPAGVRVVRRRHATGVAELAIVRTLVLPAALAPDRMRRDAARARLTLTTVVRLVPGAGRVDVDVQLEQAARDHRLRLLFPSGRPAARCLAATTFDVASRPTAVPDAAGWVHPAPATFPAHGLVAVNGLAVAAPGLYETEVTPDGTIAVTLVRAVGWLARLDVRTRPQPAGPVVPTPGAQCLGPVRARLALLPAADLRAARDAELGLRAVAAGPAPLLEPGRSLLAVEPRGLVLTALKPADDGDGVVLRLLNPGDALLAGRVTTGFPVAEVVPVRLDETPLGPPCATAGSFAVDVPPHAQRSFRLR
jgi:mannosylglycerate hydrolase